MQELKGTIVPAGDMEHFMKVATSGVERKCAEYMTRSMDLCSVALQVLAMPFEDHMDDAVVKSLMSLDLQQQAW